MSPILAITLVVILISSWCGWHYSAAKILEKPVRVMVFVGFFWLSAFIQVILLALAYTLWLHA